MIRILKTNKNIIKILLLVLLGGVFILGGAACSSSDGSSKVSTTIDSIRIGQQADSTPAITINAFGAIPIPHGQTFVDTNTWVHNNTSEPISNITYTASFNGIDVTSDVIDQKSAAADAVLGSSGEMPLLIHTPDNCFNSGGVVITAHYTTKSGNFSYSSTFTCDKVADDNVRGVVIPSPAPVVYNVHGSKLYATIYALGTGNDIVYNNLQASTSPGVRIANNNFAQSGMTFAANEVQAMELEIDSNVSEANLTLKSSTGGNSFLSQVNVGVLQQSGPILLALNNILFDSSQTNQATINVINPSIESVSVTSVTSSNSALNVQNNSCAVAVIAPGGVCSVTVQLNGSQPESGLQLSQVQILYKGTQSNVSGSLPISVQWYNKTGFQPLTIQTGSVINTFATLPVSQTVTVSNPGGYPLQLPSTLPAITDLSGNTAIVTAQLSYAGGVGGCVSNQILTQGQSCTLKLAFSSSAVASGNFLLNIPFSLGSTLYNRYYMVSYSVLPYAPLITANPSSINQPTTGLLGQITKTITLSNSGPVAGVVSVSTPSYNVDTQKISSTCPGGNSSLTDFGRTVIGQLGSVPAASGGVPGTCSITYAHTIGFTTTITLQLKYYGGSISSASPNLYSIPMVWSYSDGLSQSFAATGHMSGSGTSASPFVFSGAGTAPKVITFTVTNNIGGSETLQAITNNVSASQWLLTNTGVNPCIANSTQLNPGQSCTLTFTNVMSNTNLGSMTSYNSSLTIPRIVIKSGNSTATAANTLTAYATINQAVVTPQSPVIGGTPLTRTVTLTKFVTNEIGYSPFTIVTSSMAPYVNPFISYIQISGSCNVTTLSSTGFSHTCEFANNPTLSSESASIQYTLTNIGGNSAPYSFILNNTINKNGQVIGFSSAESVNISAVPPILHLYAVDNNGAGFNNVNYFYHFGIVESSPAPGYLGSSFYQESIAYPSSIPGDYVGLGSVVNGNYLYLMLGTNTYYESAEPLSANGSIFIYQESITGAPSYTNTIVSKPSSVVSWHPIDLLFESAISGGITYTYAYVVDDLNKAIWIYKPSANGMFTYSGSVGINPAILAAGMVPTSITVDESSYVYVAYNNMAAYRSQVWRYTINPTTGLLTVNMQIGNTGTPIHIGFIRENKGVFFVTASVGGSAEKTGNVFGSLYVTSFNGSNLNSWQATLGNVPIIKNDVLYLAGGSSPCGVSFNLVGMGSDNLLQLLPKLVFNITGAPFDQTTCSFGGPMSVYQP